MCIVHTHTHAHTFRKAHRSKRWESLGPKLLAADLTKRDPASYRACSYLCRPTAIHQIEFPRGELDGVERRRKRGRSDWMPAGNRLVGEEAPPSLSSNLGCILSPNTRSPTSLQGHGRKDTFRGKRTFLLHPPLLNFPFCICNFPSVYEPSKGMTRPCVERGVVYFRFDSISKEKYYLRYI